MKKLILATIAAMALACQVRAQATEPASAALIKRLLPNRYNSFVVEPLKSNNGRDAFELQSRGSKIVLRGNNGVAVASALYYYLTEYCHCQVTWNGTNLHLPAVLPVVAHKVVKNTPYKLRYYLNYCTFNYTMSWWDWPRWEKEIDWMALHGLNMPLAITGEEYTWYQVYKELGFTDNELKDFFTGPAYFSWFWMGNMDKWGGPLPLHWMQSHYALQKKILARERALGMKPVLPAFTGHVPAAFKIRFPEAKLKTTNWHNGFADTYILDSEDPLFARIGKLFLEKQRQLMGTNHYYSADTFNENEPPSDNPEYLSKLSARVYEGMRQADSSAVWVMQGWLFYSDRKFWKEPQTRALLSAIPNDKMIVLDLATEIEPVWKRTDAFYGKPWIWNMLNNFGGNTNLFGRMDVAAEEPAKALHNLASGKLTGIGLTMEGTETNPVLYELLTDNIWRNEPINADLWLTQYQLNRYGKNNAEAAKAWKILHSTVYTVPPDKFIRDGAESIIQGRPTLDSSAAWASTRLNYNAKDLLPAWQAMVNAAPDLKQSDGYQFDLVDLTRQVLANYALPLQRKWVAAYQRKDLADFKKYSTEYITLIDDMDCLLATRRDFLLGRWVADARSNGITPNEKALYEFNAKDLITLWGDKDSPLHEYACKQWSGLLSDFYKPRWQQFFEQLTLDIEGKKTLDKDTFAQQIKNWEWNWVNTRKDYPTQTQGNPVDEALRLYKKYWDVVSKTY